MRNFIFFILGLFVLAALLRVEFFFSILYLFVGVYILTYLWSKRTLTRLHLERRLPERAFQGDRIEAELLLKNNSRLPLLWLVVDETLPVELSSPAFFREVVSLGGQARHICRYTLRARRRGYYKIGPLQLKTGDMLGIRRNLGDRIPPSRLIIYPRVVPIHELGLPTHSPQVVLPTPMPLFQDPARLIGVRDYQMGDNPRHIHWTATASKGQIMLKQFQPAIARDTVIFLNMCRPDYALSGYPDPIIELAITTVASLAHHIIIREELPVGLVSLAFDPLPQQTNHFRLKPNKGRDHLMQLLEVLARVQALETETHFVQMLRQEAAHLSWGTTLIIVTSHESETLLNTVIPLKRAGYRPSLVLVEPGGDRFKAAPPRPQGDGGASLLGIPTYHIKQEKDLETWP